MSNDLADGTAAAVATADGYFAAALCRIIAEGRDAGSIDPEMLALEVDFALRGCYFQADPATADALRARAAALLEMAGGATKLKIEFGKPTSLGLLEADARGRLLPGRE